PGVGVAVQNNELSFFNGDVTIGPQRTVRLPSDKQGADDKPWPLPAGLGPFAVQSASSLINASQKLRDSYDVVIPVYNNEAAWFSFQSKGARPCLIKMFVGGVNVVTGKAVTAPDLNIDPAKQDYFVCGSNIGEAGGAASEYRAQPWSDGIRKGPKTVAQY